VLRAEAIWNSRPASLEGTEVIRVQVRDLGVRAECFLYRGQIETLYRFMGEWLSRQPEVTSCP
jgi:hypothetical protein